MHPHTTARSPAAAVALYELLNPIPTGFFVAAWIFDILYMKSAVTMWTDAASWLVAIGLVVAIIPRLISLGQIWPGRRHLHGPAQRLHFWLNLVAIVLAIINAFIHSRDAYAVVPAGVILSTLVVALLLLANVQLALRQRTA